MISLNQRLITLENNAGTTTGTSGGTTDTTALQSQVDTNTNDISDIQTNKQDKLKAEDHITIGSISVDNTITTTTTTTTTAPDFDTLVIRRPTGISGIGTDNNNRIGFREIQVWVSGSYIMVNNNVSAYFAEFTNNRVDIGFTFSPDLAINNIVEELTDNDTTLSESDTIDIALIFKGIPLSSVDNLQAFVLYNITSNATGGRAIGLAIELYDSRNDPNLTNALATTNVIEILMKFIVLTSLLLIHIQVDFQGEIAQRK